MDMSKYAGKDFVKLESVTNGPRRETIVDVRPGSFDRPAATFASGAELTLNATNTKTLIHAYGKDSRNWRGCIVELYAGEIPYQGQKKPGVLLRPVTPAKDFDEMFPPPAQEPEADPMDDPIPFA